MYFSFLLKSLSTSCCLNTLKLNGCGMSLLTTTKFQATHLELEFYFNCVNGPNPNEGFMAALCFFAKVFG